MFDGEEVWGFRMYRTTEPVEYANKIVATAEDPSLATVVVAERFLKASMEPATLAFIGEPVAVLGVLRRALLALEVALSKTDTCGALDEGIGYCRRPKPCDRHPGR